MYYDSDFALLRQVTFSFREPRPRSVHRTRPRESHSVVKLRAFGRLVLPAKTPAPEASTPRSKEKPGKEDLTLAPRRHL